MVPKIIRTCKGAKSLSLCASRDGQAFSEPLHNPKMEGQSSFNGQIFFSLSFKVCIELFFPINSTFLSSQKPYLGVVPGLEENPESWYWPVEGVALLHCLLVNLLPVGSQHLETRYLDLGDINTYVLHMYLHIYHIFIYHTSYIDIYIKYILVTWVVQQYVLEYNTDYNISKSKSKGTLHSIWWVGPAAHSSLHTGQPQLEHTTPSSSSCRKVT